MANTEYDVFYYWIDDEVKGVLTELFPDLADQFQYQYPNDQFFADKWFIPASVVETNAELYQMLVAYQMLNYQGFMWSHHPSFVG